MSQVLCIPFAWTNDAVDSTILTTQDWVGTIKQGQEWYYADLFLMLTFGGIPWQVQSFDNTISSSTRLKT